MGKNLNLQLFSVPLLHRGQQYRYLSTSEQRNKHNIFLPSVPLRHINQQQRYSKTKLQPINKSLATKKTGRRHMLEKYIEMLRYEGYPLPEKLTEEQIQILMTRNLTEKKRYIQYLSTTKIFRDKYVAKKVREKEKNLKEWQEVTQLKEYRFGKNCLFVNAGKGDFESLYHTRLLSSMLFGQTFILDLGFDQFVKTREVELHAKHIQAMIRVNKVHSNPFNLIFCNFNLKSNIFNTLQRRIPKLLKPQSPVNIFPISYLELFPKEKLIYVTSDAEKEIGEYDHNSIYIIGGILGKTNVHLSFNKATRENIKTVKLPRHEDLRFEDMIAIFLEAKETGDWIKAIDRVSFQERKNKNKSFT